MKKLGIRQKNQFLFVVVFHIVILWGLGQENLLAQEPRIFEGHTFIVDALAFSPDGKTLASGSSSMEGTVRLWDLRTGKTRIELTPSAHLPERPGNVEGIAPVQSLQFSADGKVLMVCLSAFGDPLLLYDPQTGKLQKYIRTKADPYKIALHRMQRGAPPARGAQGGGGGGMGTVCYRANLSADAKYIITASGLNDQHVAVWDTEGHVKLTLRGVFKGNLFGVAFVSETPGTVPLSKAAFISIDHNANIQFWNRNGKEIKNWNAKENLFLEPFTPLFENSLKSMAISPDFKTLVLSSMKKTCVLDLEKYAVKKDIVNDMSAHPMAFSADSKRLAWYHGRTGITVRDFDTKRRIDTIGKRGSNTNRLALSPDGKILATVGTSSSKGETEEESIKRYSTIRVWSLDGEN